MFALNRLLLDGLCYRVTNLTACGSVRADLTAKNKEVQQLRSKVEEYKENLHKVRLHHVVLFLSEYSSTLLHACIQEADLVRYC